MRWHRLLLLCVVALVLALQPLQTAAEEAKGDGSDAASAASGGPPKSARDDDPVIQLVRGLRNEAMKANDRKDYEKAVEKLREAITHMHYRVFGPGREEVEDPKDQAMDASMYAQILTDYGNVLVRAKLYVEAVDVLEDAVEILKRVYGESHPSFGLSTRSLADAYMAKKDYKNAIEKFKVLRKHVRLGLGKDHEAHVEANLRIGECYKELGDLKKAVKAYKKAVGMGKDGVPSGEVTLVTKGVAETYMAMATALTMLGEMDEAAKAGELARSILKEREGEDTLAYAFSLNALAGVRMRQQKGSEAYQLLHQAHAIAVKIYGPKHEMARASAKTLKEVKTHLDALKKKDEL